MLKHLLFILFSFVLLFQNSLACTMYKLTKDGKTIVGNNEDWITPNTQLWTETAGEGQFSVMYFGFMDMPQGAINEAGLLVDGFATNPLKVEASAGKLKVSLDSILVKVMQTMRTVEEVKALYQTLDLSEMAQYQLVFVDQSGTYLIIEGDEFILGEDSEKTFSNFYYSQTTSVSEVALPYYQKGLSFIDSTSPNASMEYCSTVMENMAQTDFAATQYSTLYDLSALKVRVYYHHDFSHFIELDLLEEFSKEDYKVKMADLYPESSLGKQFYRNYNNPEKPYWFLEQSIGSGNYTEAQLTGAGIPGFVTMMAREWAASMDNPTAAIQVLEYGLKLMPGNAGLYSQLGELQVQLQDYTKAVRNFEQSLQLDSTNTTARNFLEQLNNKPADQ